MVPPTSANFSAGRPRFSAPSGAMSLMLRCFSVRKFSLFPLPSQHENEIFSKTNVARECFLKTPQLSAESSPLVLPPSPFSAPVAHPRVKPAGASHAPAHVRPHTHPPQSLFVFCLHPFTRTSQTAISQHVRCEGFCSFPSRSARLPSRQHEKEKEKTAKR